MYKLYPHFGSLSDMAFVKRKSTYIGIACHLGWDHCMSPVISSSLLDADSLLEKEVKQLIEMRGMSKLQIG